MDFFSAAALACTGLSSCAATSAEAAVYMSHVPHINASFRTSKLVTSTGRQPSRCDKSESPQKHVTKMHLYIFVDRRNRAKIATIAAPQQHH